MLINTWLGMPPAHTMHTHMYMSTLTHTHTHAHTHMHTHTHVKVTVSIRDRSTYNVAVSELMIFSNLLKDSQHLVGSCDYHEALCTLCTLLAPMAPHIASEMWVELSDAARQLQMTSPQVRSFRCYGEGHLILTLVSRVTCWSNLGLNGVTR